MKTTPQLRHQIVPIKLWHFSNCFHLAVLLPKGQNKCPSMDRPYQCHIHGMLDDFIVMKLFHFS